MKEKSMKTAKFLQGFLSVSVSVLFLTIVGFFIILFKALGEDVHYEIIVIVSIVTTISFSSVIFYIVILLKRIIKSITTGNPFIEENITYFKRIGYLIITLGTVYSVVNYPKGINASIAIIRTPNGALTPAFFIYICLGCMAIILGDVFKMAIEIKDENDLTV